MKRHNFHTIATRYDAFAKMRSRDVYNIKPGTQAFSAKSLEGVKILVTANTLNVANEKEWSKPTPSAFKHDQSGSRFHKECVRLFQEIYFSYRGLI
ncbi:hypothetical protein [Dyadobacter frigoris]|uniref:hypothetical protein n=1 Tax=Dyadobacter frigoris TaxID=2576211 RepID=UPI00148569E7|nr:hypothetical protein [Dyadobacter frigoris]GLU52045.1 hypothetical protein Dfri01_15060 [Dyadobacter frigoris]